MCTVVNQAIWLQRLLGEIGLLNLKMVFLSTVTTSVQLR